MLVVKELNHSVIHLLRSFSEKEKQQFFSFLQSEYLSSDVSIALLLKSIQKHILSKESSGEDVLIKIYQDISTSQNTLIALTTSQRKYLSNKMSLLMRKAKNFLAIEFMKKNKHYQQDLEQKALLEKQQYRICGKQLKKDKKENTSATKKGLHFFKQTFQMAWNELEYLYQTNQLLEKDNFEELNFKLDMFYLVSKLRIHCTTLNIQELKNNTAYDVSSFEAINTILALPKYAEQPIIKLYTHLIQLIRYPAEASDSTILKLLNKYHHSFSNRELLDFYVSISNLYIRKIRHGQTIYNPILLDLYKNMESKGLIFNNGVVSMNRLNNMITQSCKVKDFDWAKMLVQKYLPFVPKEEKDNFDNYHNGIIASSQADYPKAIHHLIRVNTKEIGYQLNSHLTLITTHYHLDKEYDERTIRLYRNTEQNIINNKKFTTSIRKGSKNFIRLLINLYKLKHGVGKSSIDKLKTKVENQQIINGKKWLLDRIEELQRG